MNNFFRRLHGRAAHARFKKQHGLHGDYEVARSLSMACFWLVAADHEVSYWPFSASRHYNVRLVKLNATAWSVGIQMAGQLSAFHAHSHTTQFAQRNHGHLSLKSGPKFMRRMDMPRYPLTPHNSGP